jgi:hypothetical protein
MSGEIGFHEAALWALASDENFRQLLVWRRVEARARAGGFNGVLVHDYRAADEALAGLVAMVPADRIPSGEGTR